MQVFKRSARSCKSSQAVRIARPFAHVQVILTWPSLGANKHCLKCQVTRKEKWPALCLCLYLMKTKCFKIGNVEKLENGLSKDLKKDILITS